MIYRLINGERIIAQVISNFNLDNSDWIPKSPQWILDALSDIRVSSNLEDYSEDIEIIGRKVALPCDIKSLTLIAYNDEEVTREDVTTGIKNNYLTYQLLHNNYILLNQEYFDAGDTVTVYFKSLPVTLSPTYNIHIPSVPDNFALIQAITYYILIQYLYHGYTHKVFSLNSNSPFTNPEMKYAGVDGKGGLRMVARNSINSLDKHAMENVLDRARMLNENPDNRRSRNFKQD